MSDRRLCESASSVGAICRGSPLALAVTAAARAWVTFSRVWRSCAAYPRTDSRRLGMRWCRRFSSTSICDHASCVRLRLRMKPLKTKTRYATRTTESAIRTHTHTLTSAPSLHPELADHHTELRVALVVAGPARQDVVVPVAHQRYPGCLIGDLPVDAGPQFAGGGSVGRLQLQCLCHLL